MILQIRTKDNLEELLKHFNSPAWIIAEAREKDIQQVEIFQFDGKRVLKGDFDKDHSFRTTEGRLVVVFQNGKIEDADHKWIGQNSVKYNDSNIVSNMSGLNSIDSLNPEQLNWINEKYSIDYIDAPHEWLNSKDFIVEAIKKDIRILKYAADEFIVKEIVEDLVINNNRIDFENSDLIYSVGKWYLDKVNTDFENWDMWSEKWGNLIDYIKISYDLNSKEFLNLARIYDDEYLPTMPDDDEDGKYPYKWYELAIERADTVEELLNILNWGFQSEYFDLPDLRYQCFEKVWEIDPTIETAISILINSETEEPRSDIDQEFLDRIVAEIAEIDAEENLKQAFNEALENYKNA